MTNLDKIIADAKATKEHGLDTFYVPVRVFLDMAEVCRAAKEARQADAESVSGGPCGSDDAWNAWWNKHQRAHGAAYAALDAALSKLEG